MARPRRSHSLLLATTLLLAALAPGRPPAAGAQPPDLPGAGPWVVRAYYADRHMVQALVALLEPWEVHHDEGWLLAAAGPAQVRALLDLGFRLELDVARTAELVAPRVAAAGQVAGIPGYPCYRTVEETFAAAAALAAAYPGLATWTDVGDSWEKATATDPDLPGYDLWVLRLTNQSLPGPKPKILILASIHAREYAPAELATRFAEHLAAGYGVDADITWLLDWHEIHLLLQGNPDGRKQAEAGSYWRKNTDRDDGCDDGTAYPDYQYWGVDLNRNFEFAWGGPGASTLPCYENYRGPAAASEPETVAVQAYLRAQFPDQRLPDLSAAAPADAWGVFLDLHSYGGYVLWPWGFTTSLPPNSTALQTLGRKLAYWNGAIPGQASDPDLLYMTSGATDDFAYGDLGLAAYTFEIGTAFFQDCTAFQNAILPGNLPALTYAAKVARAPYQTPAGPDARDLSLSPPLVGWGRDVRVEATLDDTRYSSRNGSEPVQSIAGGELTVDVPPWAAGATSVALLPLDGAWDAGVEAVAAVLPTAGLAPGRHILYVRGRDAAGNWGAVSAAFLYVTAHRAYLPAVSRQALAE